MAIPDYQSIMLPLLLLAKDGVDHRVSDATNALAEEFDLTPADRLFLLPSGRQAAFSNRVGWARTYLTRAGLLSSPQRGVFRITDRGEQVLQESPARIDVRFLRRFPELLEFIGQGSNQKPSIDDAADTEQTPDDAIETRIERLNRALAQDLLEHVRALDPTIFEKLVLRLLQAMGYGDLRADAIQHTGKTGDQGIDGLINEDELGLDAVYIQAKKWTAPVGGPEVRNFAGSLAGKHATKGVLITTSTFTTDAKDFVRVVGQRIVLIDGERLALLMIKHGVAVTTIATYAVKQIDIDYFETL
jgi:restriction system protein